MNETRTKLLNTSQAWVWAVLLVAVLSVGFYHAGVGAGDRIARVRTVPGVVPSLSTGSEAATPLVHQRRVAATESRRFDR